MAADQTAPPRRLEALDLVQGENALYFVGFDPAGDDPHVTVTVKVGHGQPILVIDEPAPIADEIAKMVRRAVRRVS